MQESLTKITFLGHTTILVEYGDTRVIIDPNFSRGLPLMRRHDSPVFTPREMHRVHTVLFSNPRLNRLNIGSLKYFKQNTTRVLLPKGLAKFVKRFYQFPVTEIEPNQEIDVGNIRITPIPSRHFSMRFFLPHQTSLNFLLRTPDKTIFYCSDLKYDKDFFTQIGTGRTIDLAVLPIDYVGNDFVNKGNFLNVTDALKAFGDLGAKTMLPNAYGSFVWKGRNPHLARQALENAVDTDRSLKERVKILDPGASMAV